ncbi:carboxypeptidase-like regulatory domain-containing protein [Saccharicrinis sp. FJH2]|uniref:carboxypeptidase-like regulatory domain-containing protein n=1 Tax=Saccharicrinis sp. FJH65 TaxID=3344659 RepID=UPI0035F2C880
MKRTLLYLMLLFVPILINAQSISGKLTDENYTPLAYVNIGVVGLNKGTISSSNGMYKIDISGVDNEKIIRFSHVGYVSIDFKVGDFKKMHDELLNLKMKEKRIQIQEITVKPSNEEPVYIGSKKAGRMAWVWSEAINGAEIGTLFRNDKSILLEKFYFHIRKNYCDSILYRIRIYSGEDEYPQKIINTKDIRFISKKEKGWDSVDLSGYNITINNDFIVTLETLASWTSEYKTTHLSVGKAKSGLSFSRASSMAPWTEFANQMSFRIEIKELKK